MDNFEYFSDNNGLIIMGLKKQQVLEADPKLMRLLQYQNSLSQKDQKKAFSNFSKNNSEIMQILYNMKNENFLTS